MPCQHAGGGLAIRIQRTISLVPLFTVVRWHVQSLWLVEFFQLVVPAKFIDQLQSPGLVPEKLE